MAIRETATKTIRRNPNRLVTLSSIQENPVSFSCQTHKIDFSFFPFIQGHSFSTFNAGDFFFVLFCCNAFIILLLKRSQFILVHKVPGSAPSNDGRLPGSHILEDILASWHFEWIRVMVVSVVSLSCIYPLWFIVCPIEQGCVSLRSTAVLSLCLQPSILFPRLRRNQPGSTRCDHRC